MTKLSQDKDKVIEDLRAKEKDLLEQLSTDQGLFILLCEHFCRLNYIPVYLLQEIFLKMNCVDLNPLTCRNHSEVK